MYHLHPDAIFSLLTSETKCKTMLVGFLYQTLFFWSRPRSFFKFTKWLERFSTRQGDPFCRDASGSNSHRLLEGPLQSVDHKAFHQAGFGAWPDLGTSVPSDYTGLRSACNSLTMSLLYINPVSMWKSWYDIWSYNRYVMGWVYHQAFHHILSEWLSIVHTSPRCQWIY